MFLGKLCWNRGVGEVVMLIFEVVAGADGSLLPARPSFARRVQGLLSRNAKSMYNFL
jgi:hypothetical protein